MVDETLLEDRERIKRELEDDDPYEDIYMLVMTEIDNFNYFLKSLKVTREKNPNVIGAIGGTVHFLLMQPIAEYNPSINIFNLKKVRYSEDLIACLKHHLPIFFEFDNRSIPQSAWIINSLAPKFVQIILKIDPKTENTLIGMNDACKLAAMNGWRGELQVITRANEKLIFPT